MPRRRRLQLGGQAREVDAAAHGAQEPQPPRASGPSGHGVEGREAQRRAALLCGSLGDGVGAVVGLGHGVARVVGGPVTEVIYVHGVRVHVPGHAHRLQPKEQNGLRALFVCLCVQTVFVWVPT